MSELLSLLAHAGDWPAHPEVFVTTTAVWRDRLLEKGRVFVVGECNRRNPLRVVSVAVRALWFAVKERPDVVISTGSAPLAFVCLFTKMLGGKVVWIDSVAQFEVLSVSGRVMRHVADLCLSQWPEVATRYRNVEYAGQLL